MSRRSIPLAVGAVAILWVSHSAAAPKPTTAQIKAAIATHSDEFVLANSYAYGGRAPGHGWIDLETGAGRWVSANGKRVWLESVRPETKDPAHVVVTYTNIDYATRTWTRSTREEPAKSARPRIIDPLDVGSAGVRFRFLGVESVDGRPTYHLRSTTYFFPGPAGALARLDVWFSTDHAYLIRYTRTTRAGRVVQRVDNHWLPRAEANLALLARRVPTGFRREFVSP